MGTISAASVRQSEVQLRPNQPWTETTTTPPAPFIPSTSAPSSLSSGVTLEAVMAQFECMDAHLDTLTTELY